MLRRLLAQSLRPYIGLIVGVAFFQLAQSIANLYLPSLNADIIDNGVATGDIPHIWRIGAVMLALSLVQILSAITAVYFAAKLAMSVGRDLRMRIFAKVGDFAEGDLQSFGAPTLITRNTNDVQQVQMLVLISSTMLISAPFTAIGGVILALQQDVVLSWIMVVAIPLLLVIVSLIIWRMMPHFERMQKRIDAVNKVLREQLTGIRVVRAFVREKAETARFAHANELVTDSALRAGRLMAAMFPLVTLILNVSSVAVLWWGAERVESGQMQVGALTAFLSYLMQILMSVMMATYLFVILPRASVSGGRIMDVLTTTSSVQPPADPVLGVDASGTVEFEAVTYQYPGAEEPVLKDITFTAAPGTTTAIVGATGAGKTTLVNLVARLHDATSGTVHVDGVDVRDRAPEELWSSMAMVPQRPYLFSGTVASNLRYGRDDATDDDLWRALQTAQAADFVRAMPDGLDTAVSQGGTTVSGGQRQRLAIARALVRGASIQIFDDAFSALDTATDARLRAALAEDDGGATRIVVAQRVSSVMQAEQILVIEDGVIAARGTHAELLETSATYQEIVSTQLRSQEAA